MSKIDQIVRTKGYKNFMAKLYGWGASVVILGALFKILHLPGANIMLILGMGIESVIFFFSAFEPLHVEYNWALVYPELATGSDIELEEETKKFLESCMNATYKVDNIEKKPTVRYPAPPFTTSTLQQEAARKLGFSVANTMRIAQPWPKRKSRKTMARNT